MTSSKQDYKQVQWSGELQHDANERRGPQEQEKCNKVWMNKEVCTGRQSKDGWNENES